MTGLSYRPRIEVPEVNENAEYDPDMEESEPEDITPLDFHDDSRVNWGILQQMGYDYE